MPSRWPGIERARPLLGTRVAVRVHGLAEKEAHAAIDDAYAEVAEVHRLMSFHEPDSDVSRLNREAHRGATAIDPRTYAVIAKALVLSEASGGAFDISVAPHLVARGVLPVPEDAPPPDAGADWRDIVLCEGNRVAFRRPLWIDLGGIAKGYAVDRAIDALSAFAPRQACVNAGGDLRLAGPESESVRLTPDGYDRDDVPVIALADGSIASSCGTPNGRRRHEPAPHVDTLHDEALGPQRFVSVTAPLCVDADGLTKIVMAFGRGVGPVLEKFGARAVGFDAEAGWHEIGAKP